MDKPKESPSLKQAHLQAAACPDTNQSLQKSLLSQTLWKNKKSSPLKKNKTLPTHSPSDKNVLTEIVEKLKGMSLEKKEGQLVTKAICNKGFRGNSSILPRIKFCVGGQDSSPQSLTAYSLNRYAAA